MIPASGSCLTGCSLLYCGFPLHPSPLVMRFAALALLIALAAPAQAQLSFAPVVGYDLDAEGPSIGLAFEIGAPLTSIPLTPSFRPLVEYVFVDGTGGADISLIRANADLLARFQAGPTAAFQPYAKAGVTVSNVSVDGLDGSDTDVGLNVGGGLEFTRIFVEGELGIGGTYDGFRIRGGYRF